MRMFRARMPPEDRGPAYRCQEDGMVGLGCGARSYTRALHYGSEYAVGGRGVRAILDDYAGRPDHAFDLADFGCRLDDDDRRRRYVIQSLLSGEGLDLDGYARSVRHRRLRRPARAGRPGGAGPGRPLGRPAGADRTRAWSDPTPSGRGSTRSGSAG